MSYSWRKANVRPPKSLRNGLEEDRIIFREMIWKLMKLKFAILNIDEWSFSPSSIPLYSWIKKCEQPEKIIRNTTDRYNSIAVQWEKNIYFMIKDQTSNEESVWCFKNQLMKQLKLTISYFQKYWALFILINLVIIDGKTKNNDFGYIYSRCFHWIQIAHLGR